MTYENYLVSIESNGKKEEYRVTINQDTEKNLYFYKEPNKTNVIFDYKNNVLKRDNEEMNLEFKFKLKEKTINNIYIKELNNVINIEIYTEDIIHDLGSI